MQTANALTRIPSLDGLRAVSILLVIFSHISQTYHWSQSVPFIWRLTPGATGVSVFFVISGYLISSLLLREQAATGRISLRDFYLRRVFRIVPAYLVYIGVIALLAQAGVVTAEAQDFVAALLYVTNYVQAHWVLLHTWSLSVEEQFYLLFPLLLLASTRRLLVMVLGATLCLSIAARLLNQVWGIWPVDAMYSFEGRADQLAFGSLCALFQQHAPMVRQRALANIAVPVGALLVCIAMALPVGHTRTVLLNTLIGLATALAIHGCTLRPGNGLARLLGCWPLRALGLISYSLYLWQQVWMTRELELPLSLALVGTLLCGTASFWLVERPFLQLRRRLQSATEKSAIALKQ